jgi:hypothetical protein
MQENRGSLIYTIIGFMVIGLIIIGVLFFMIWGWKSFKVWSAGQDGKAKLACI